MKIENVKFPSGQFTHSELAQLNKCTNQQIWTAYQEAIKTGVIKYIGDRKNSSGRGKPSKLYELVSGTPQPPVVPTPTPVVVLTVVEKPSSPPVVVKEPEQPVIMKAILPPVPVVEEKIETVVVVSPEPAPVFPSATKKDDGEDDDILKLEEPTETAFLCPCCEHPMLSLPQGKNRVTLFCNQPLDICPAPENPMRNASNEKEAYEYIKSIWTKKASEYAPLTAGA